MVRFYDDQDLLARHNLDLVPAPVEKLGPVSFVPSSEAGRSATFCGAIIPWQGAWRLYYSHLGDPRHSDYKLGIAESEDGRHWVKIDVGRAGFIQPAGLPPEEKLVQPQVVLLPDGRLRMYCWWHGHHLGRARYIACDSDNGDDFTILNLDDPCLFHPSDFNVGQAGFAAGLTAAVPRADFEAERTVPFPEAKRRRSNDATFVYYSERLGRFEMYSVWLVPNDAGSRHYVPHDNAPQIRRVLHRRVSEDGLRWSDPELILIPDENDPLDLQFYHLAVHEADGWRIGMLGHYRCWEQTMDLEMCFSRDGRHWRRPLRGGFIPRGGVDEVDYYSVYPTNRLLPAGEDWLLIYDGGNLKHNQQLPEGVTERRSAIMVARLPKQRIAGLRATDRMIGSLELKCIPGVEAITVDADVQGELRAELRDTFGRALEGYHLYEFVPVTGDSRAHVLRWGDGKTSQAYRYDAVILRLEVTEGTVYGVTV